MRKLALGLLGVLVGCHTVTAGSKPDAAATADAAKGTADAPLGGPADAAAVDVSQAPRPDATPACVVGDPCTSAAGNGLCSSAGSCNTCIDGTDDSNCAAVYGGTFKCVGGACIVAGCTDSSTCAGKICSLGSCVSCSQDADCAGDPTYAGSMPICDQTSFTCVSATCSQTDGTACTSNSADVCCSSTCLPGDCCGTGACTTSTGASGTCQGNQCSACPSLPGSTTDYYVDTTNGKTDGNGGMTNGCQWKEIRVALDALAASGLTHAVTLHVASGTYTLAGTASVPKFVTVVGDQSPTIPIVHEPTPASCTSNCTVIETFNMSNPSSGLSYLTIDMSNASAQLMGVYVSGNADSSTKMDHLTIQNGVTGIHVAGQTTSTPNVAIGAGMNVNNNLRNSDGNGGYGLEVSGGGSAEVSAPSTDKSVFDFNTGGIRATGTGHLKLLRTDTSGYGVYASQNAGDGIYFDMADSVDRFVGVAANNNHGTAGLQIFAGDTLTVRSSEFVSNDDIGINITAAPTTDSFSGLDFGSDDGGNAGNNTITSNLTGICEHSTDFVNGIANVLKMQGNSIGGHQCKTASDTLSVGYTTNANNCVDNKSISILRDSANNIGVNLEVTLCGFAGPP
jgi:hypothetical protein